MKQDQDTSPGHSEASDYELGLSQETKSVGITTVRHACDRRSNLIITTARAHKPISAFCPHPGRMAAMMDRTVGGCSQGALNPSPSPHLASCCYQRLALFETTCTLSYPSSSFCPMVRHWPLGIGHRPSSLTNCSLLTVYFHCPELYRS